MCSLASLPYRAYKKVWSSLKRSHNIELLIAMSVAHCSVFLILVFAIRLGHPSIQCKLLHNTTDSEAV